MTIKTYLSLSLVCAILANNAEAQLPISLEVKTFITNPRGYVQTPLGGRPGSSDINRPTFAELGVHRLKVQDEVATLTYFPMNIYAGYQEIHPKAVTHLPRSLLTYGRWFLKDARFKSDIRFDWYRLGIAYPFNLFNIWLTPHLEMACLTFDYGFKTSSQKAARDYRHLTLRAGLKFRIPLGNGLVILVDYAHSLPLFDALELTSSHIEIKDATQQSIGALNSTKIDYQDSQRMPNHIVIEF